MSSVPVSAITGEALRGLHERGGDGVRQLTSFSELERAVNDVIGAAVEEVCGFRNASPLTVRLLEHPKAMTPMRTIGSTGHPLSRRMTFDPAVLDLPRSTEALMWRGATGERLRFLSGLSSSVIIADTDSAVIDLTNYDSSGRGSAVVTDRRMVLALRALSDMIWSLAMPMSSSGALALDERSQQVLALLGAGLSDAAIAVQLGVSQRTVERSVRRLMQQVGATTRFQTGVLAARRGFI